ncbi:MAG: DUF3445 domain-containing protein [Pseudomonadota bacterium]
MNTVDAIRHAIARPPHRTNIGLRPILARDWIATQCDYWEQMRVRQTVIKRHPDTVQAVAGSDDAIRVVRDRLVNHLCIYHPGDYQRRGARLQLRPLKLQIDLAKTPPLEAIARLVPDDICVMREDDEGVYRLIAAAVCFPTRWQLTPKMGHSLMDIHAPVPTYREHIGHPMDTLFRRTPNERIVCRANWSIVDSPELYQPVRPTVIHTAKDPDDIGRRLWVRSERQTLRRFRETRDIIFGIRIQQATLEEVCQDADTARRLCGQVESMPPALLGYKGLEAKRLMDYLSR